MRRKRKKRDNRKKEGRAKIEWKGMYEKKEM